MKLVQITWRDITSNGDGWHSADEVDNFINEDNTVVSVGFIYEQDEDQIILLDSYFVNKELFGGIHKIPKGCIISIKEFAY